MRRPICSFAQNIQRVGRNMRWHSWRMDQKQLLAAAVRTLRAGITPKHPPAERPEHLLARLDVIIERSARRNATTSLQILQSLFVVHRYLEYNHSRYLDSKQGKTQSRS